MDLFGSTEIDAKELYALMIDLVASRRALAQNIVDNQGQYKTIKKTAQESKAQSEKTNRDPLGLGL